MRLSKSERVVWVPMAGQALSATTAECQQSVRRMSISQLTPKQ